MSDSVQYIFSYGTLQDPAVQEAVEPEDVAKADAYEVADYRRIAVTLSSGRNAYVYVAAEDAIDDLIPAEE